MQLVCVNRMLSGCWSVCQQHILSDVYEPIAEMELDNRDYIISSFIHLYTVHASDLMDNTVIKIDPFVSRQCH